MAQVTSIKESLKLILPESMYEQLHGHLFPGDNDEHGAVIVAGLAHSKRGVRLLARELFLANDGTDYVAGQRGYRMLRGEFITNLVRHCRDEQLVYLAVHNHGGKDYVSFSDDDIRSHERGYPTLLDITRGMPVGALVFAEQAVAGDIWFPDGSRVELDKATIIGTRIRHLASRPSKTSIQVNGTFDRQARLLGDTGCAILGGLKVGIIGAGGVGSLLIELLARIGVGHLVVTDPDRIDLTNLPRLIGATKLDAMSWLTTEKIPKWLHVLGRKLATPKVKYGRRLARRANPTIRYTGIIGDFLEPDIAAQFLDCDYMFLAADTMQARLLFNAVVHQYYIPGVQVGAKALVKEATGDLLQVYSVTRPVTPDTGCLWCNGLISSAKLQDEAQTADERRAQRYINEPEVIAPSVITLNAQAAAQAANDFLFAVTGLTLPEATNDYVMFAAQHRTIKFTIPRSEDTCLECGILSKSRRGRGDQHRLPTKNTN
jgi:tRNA A37 threonylcarbamoyladenosine dehydratase